MSQTRIINLSKVAVAILGSFVNKVKGFHALDLTRIDTTKYKADLEPRYDRSRTSNFPYTNHYYP